MHRPPPAAIEAIVAVGSVFAEVWEAMEMAVSLWMLVFSQSEPTILKKWLHFLEKHPQASVSTSFCLVFYIILLSAGERNTKRHLEYVPQLCQHCWN